MYVNDTVNVSVGHCDAEHLTLLNVHHCQIGSKNLKLNLKTVLVLYDLPFTVVMNAHK